MRAQVRLLSILTLLGLSIAFFPVAEGQTSGSPSVGYAIVTVASGNSADIAPSETLVFAKLGATGQTVVAPPTLLTSSAIAVNLGTTADPSTGIAIVNPSTTTGNVQLSVTDPQGTPILNQTIAILPRGQISRFLNELFAGQVTTGTP